MLPRPLFALVAVFATLQISQGFQLSPRTNALSRLSVASQDTEKATEKVPYSISRGDGSTGGGGRSMPNKNAGAEQSTVEDDDEELKRPKVGAEMPHGRPSWFRVPAPSQGMSIGVLYRASASQCISIINYMCYTHTILSSSNAQLLILATPRSRSL
jgi:hypothetical protein